MEVEHESVKVVKLVNERITHVRWKINRIAAQIEEMGTENEISGDDVSLDESKANVSMTLYRGMDNEDDDDRVFWLDFCVSNSNNFDFTFTGKYWIENADGKKCMVGSFCQDNFEHIGDEIYTFSGESAFMSETHLRDFFKDDVGIACLGIQYRVCDEKYEPPTADSDFRRGLWADRTDESDEICTFHVENKKIKVIKSVLTSQSEVFNRMLTANTKEAKTGIIEIKDIPADIVKAFVEYLYIGHFEDLDLLVPDLFDIADKYNVESLKKECRNSIVQALSKDTLLNSIILAYQHSDSALKQEILKFIKDPSNKCTFVSLVTSKKWFDFSSKNFPLAHEISTNMFDKFKFKW